MSRFVAVHSHSGGTGKSHIAANVAVLLAGGGLRVCLVDTDLQAPAQYMLFGLAAQSMTGSVTHHLVEGGETSQSVHDLTHRLAGTASPTGRLWLVPAQPRATLIESLLTEGYDAGLLDDFLRDLADLLAPDVVIIDTHSGMTNETLVALSLADCLTIVMRHDEQEYGGAGVIGSVTRRLSCPTPVLVANMVPDFVDVAAVRARVAEAYGSPLSVVVPYSTRMVEIASSGVLALLAPDDELMPLLRRLARETMRGLTTGEGDELMRRLDAGMPGGNG